jgi:hypothetical protein
MLILDDIEYKSNIFYNNENKTFEDIIPNNIIESSEIINYPIIVIHTLHSCFSHAILDSCFPIFWIIDDLISNNYIKNNDINNIKIFIKKENILNYSIQNLPLIDKDNKTYRGAFKNIIELLTDKSIIFEHLIDNNIIFKECFFYPDNDYWQRTPWNCIDYYPGRNVEKENIRFTDEIIYNKLHKFRNKIIDKSMIQNTDKATNELIIIDRKNNRKFDNFMIESLIKEANKNTNWIFKGVFILEDLNFYDQVALFNKTRFFILRHGSSSINLLWTQPKSIIFELMGGREGINTSPVMYQRICKLTNSTLNTLNYDSYDIKNNIFNKLI